jgi:hypothetical protein
MSFNASKYKWDFYTFCCKELSSGYKNLLIHPKKKKKRGPKDRQSSTYIFVGGGYWWR